MDKLLRPVNYCAKVFIDDVVIWSTRCNNHLQDLEKVFTLFQKLGVGLNPKKSYLEFPSLVLLGQHIDGLGMTTSEEKIAAIIQLKMPTTICNDRIIIEECFNHLLL